jgi:hypothetical protein
MTFNRVPMGQKEPREADPEYLAKVRSLRCCICEAFGERQETLTQAHHVFHGRFSGRKTPDRMAIPLCEGHHLGMVERGKLAVHRDKTAWAEAYGEDWEYSAPTQDKILGAA